MPLSQFALLLHDPWCKTNVYTEAFFLHLIFIFERFLWNRFLSKLKIEAITCEITTVLSNTIVPSEMISPYCVLWIDDLGKMIGDQAQEEESKKHNLWSSCLAISSTWVYAQWVKLYREGCCKFFSSYTLGPNLGLSMARAKGKYLSIY